MLRQLQWLSGLARRNSNRWQEAFRIRTFSQGEKLLKEQEPDNGLFLIVEGTVKVEIRDILMGAAGPGKVLG